MPVIDGRKFACSACVKGHRSSSCNHADRPLQEIRRKGRPATQCSHCRELRRTSKVHVACRCNEPKSPAGPLAPGPSSPVASATPAEPGAPCACDSTGECTCSAPPHPTAGARAHQDEAVRDLFGISIQGLIDAATSKSKPPAQMAASSSTDVPLPAPTSVAAGSCCGGSRAPVPPALVAFAEIRQPLAGRGPGCCEPGPGAAAALPPLPPAQASPTSSCPSPRTSPRDSALFLPSTAGTASCFCGPQCPCPGCVLHDPLGKKFRRQSGAPASQGMESGPCPTSLPNRGGCLGGVDLPTIEEILRQGESSSLREDRPQGASGPASPTPWLPPLSALAPDHSPPLSPLPPLRGSQPGCRCCGASCSCVSCTCKAGGDGASLGFGDPMEVDSVDAAAPPFPIPSLCPVPSCGIRFG